MSRVVATEEHQGPRREGPKSTRDALVVAFPRSVAVPVPIPGQAVGREWLDSLGLADTRVSTQHLVFHRAGGQLFVEDLGSRNGTFVAGARLAPKERASLDDGALLRVGRVLFVYRQDFIGTDAPSAPLGRIVAPFGMRRVAEGMRSLAALKPNNVLIEGETGTGKELVAHAFAESMGRAHRYAPINVAGMASGVFESQLFGYVAGAYSGGGKGSPGVFRAHDGGAVFLDEIGELPLDLQAKLLRVLDNREVLAVGATSPTVVDVVVISATNRSLEDCVQQGTFRRDLLARLGYARVDLPPLRERAEDIFAIAQAWAASRGETLDPAQVEVEAVERLMRSPWLSNIRELTSTMLRVRAMESAGSLHLESVERVLGPAPPVAAAAGLSLVLVQQAIAETGNESAAARKLGISRGKLLRFLGRNAHAK